MVEQLNGKVKYDNAEMSPAGSRLSSIPFGSFGYAIRIGFSGERNMYLSYCLDFRHMSMRSYISADCIVIRR